MQSVPITCCEIESHSCQGVLNTTLCDKVCQCLWFLLGIPVSFNKTIDCFDITGRLLKVAFNTITSYNTNP